MTDYQVTNDPELLAALHARDEAGIDSQALGKYAVEELGIEPPRRLADGSAPSIVMEWQDADFDGPGVPVWALDMGEADSDDDYDPTGSGWESAGWSPAPSPADATYIVHYDVVYEPVHQAEEIGQILDEDANTTNPQGSGGITYWLGRRDSDDENHPLREPVLRVDVDPETGAGAVRWLPDNLVGVEQDYAPTVVIVSESSADPLVWIPPAIGRVSYAAAREAAERYIATGARPDNVTWIEAEPS